MFRRLRGTVAALALSVLVAPAAAANGGPTGDALVPITPCRAVDTRLPADAPSLGPFEKRIFTLAPGACGVPVATAHEVAINITVVGPTAEGHTQIFAGNAATPETSVLNFTPGRTRASNTIVALASDDSGTIALVNGSNGTADFIIDVTGYFITACPTITVSPAGPALTAGTQGAPYSQTFTASGGSGTYTFAVTAGAPPAPLSLSSVGDLSGTPAVAGDFSFTVTATDTATNCTGSQAYTLHVDCGTLTVAITPTPAQVCTLSTGNSASATAGFATYSWLISNGTITSLANIQTITYTAGASGTVGLTVDVTDASACPGQATTNVAINALPSPPTITTSGPQTFTVSGASGTFTLTFNGQTTSALAFNATAGDVESALDALSSIGGVSGSVAVSQALGVYTVTFGGTLTGPQPQLTGLGAGGCTVVVSPPAVCADSTGNQASGPAGATTYAWGITNGTITSATNIQTITYTAGPSGNVGLTLTVTNAAGCSAQNNVDIPINPSPAPPTITPTQSPVCGNSTGNTASGPAGATTYAWSITNGTITSATDIQTITYTAGPSGNVGLTLTVTNAGNCPASNNLDVPINDAPATPTITPTPATLCANIAGNTASGPAGATTYAWSIVNGSITSATNIQTITYTAGASGTVDLTLVVTNAAGCSASNSVNVTINPLPTLSPGAGALTMGTYNTAYSQSFTPGGGTGPYTVALFSGTLPNGVTFGGTTLSGTPIEPGGVATGNFSFTLRVTDTATGCLKDFAYTLYVQPKAVADACTGVGNTQLMGGIYTPAPGTPVSTNCNGVLTNDEGPGTLSTAVSGVPVNGTVGLNSNGTFLFTPNVAATTGSFNYTLTDGNGATATGSVTLTFSGMVWFVNAGYVGTSDGRSHQPFKTVNAAQSPSGTGDTIFVHSGGSFPTSDTIALKTNQVLWGQGTSYTLGNLTLGATSKPTLTGTVTLETGVTVSSLNITPNPGSQTGIIDPVSAISGVTIKNNVAVTTTTGTAVLLSNLDSTAGGAPNNGINFLSVSSNGAANGISLTNVNATTGSFTVAGNGGACSSAGSCTGGAIQASSGPGVLLTNTGAVSFSNFDVEAGGDDGFRGSVVRGFTLASSRVVNNGNAVTERGIEILNLTGTGGISNSTISGNAEDNLYILNTSGTLTAFNVTGSTFADTSASVGNDGIHFNGQGTANMSISVTNCTFTNNRGDHFQATTDASSAAVMDIVFQNNDLNNVVGTNLGASLTLNPGGSATMTFDISNNGSAGDPFAGAFSSAITINSSNSSQMSGTINNNVIGSPGVADSGSFSGDGITIFANNTSQITVAVTNNLIRQYSNLAGINIHQRDGNGSIHATVTGNTISNPGTFVSNGLLAQAGSVAGDAGFLCLDVGGAGALANSIAGSGANGGTDFRVRQRMNTTVRLPGYGGAATDTAAVVTYIQGRNTGAETGSATVGTVPPAGGFVGGAACNQP